MAAFASPRFAGDELLEEILNDPDTGQAKLGPGSPEPSVTVLQQALFDLTSCTGAVPTPPSRSCPDTGGVRQIGPDPQGPPEPAIL